MPSTGRTLAKRLVGASEVELLAKLQEIIDQVIREKWSIRKLERHALGDADPSTGTAAAPGAEPEPHADLRSAPAAPAAATPAAAKPDSALLHQGDRVVIDVGRIDRKNISPEEREALIDLLEDLLVRVRRA